MLHDTDNALITRTSNEDSEVLADYKAVFHGNGWQAMHAARINHHDGHPIPPHSNLLHCRGACDVKSIVYQ